jgi:prepilin-type processing-associated H-X9-DG protein
LLPYVEQDNLFKQIDFSTTVGTGDNTTVSQQPVAVYLCPSDAYPQAFPVYDSTFTNPVTTLAHGNYVGCNGWLECFNGAGGSDYGGGGPAGPGADGLPGGLGTSARGAFYRNSSTRIANITDGLSNTIVVGERSGNHSPSTWTGAFPGGRVPAWMADQPPAPYSPPPGPAYDNADFGEALVLSHGNATHLPSADLPIFDPDTFYSMHTPTGANFLFGDGSVHFLNRSINATTYQSLCTIAGGEVLGDW